MTTPRKLDGRVMDRRGRQQLRTVWVGVGVIGVEVVDAAVDAAIKVGEEEAVATTARGVSIDT